MTPRQTHESVQELSRRCDELPELMREVLTLTPPDLSLERGDRVLVTGAGLAEGPARMLAAQWRAQLGICADFVPLTAFISGAPRPAEVLIICSQGLSPNARLALPCLAAFERGVLLSSARRDHDAGVDPAIQDWCAQGGMIWDLPPAQEGGGFLLRVQGPTLYTLAISSWTSALRARMRLDEMAWQHALPEVPDAYKSRYSESMVSCVIPDDVLSSPHLAMLSFGNSDDLSHGLRWKVLEGVWRHAPPVFDLLQIVHGPWQGFYGNPMALIAMVDSLCAVQGELLGRLEKMLQPTHELYVLEAKLPSPLGYFEFAAHLDALIIRDNQGASRDLVDWPGRGEDGPLYKVNDGDTLTK